MLFKFKYPQSTNLTGKQGTYETNPKHQFTCGNMTISVLDPIDNLMMTHGQHFLIKRLMILTHGIGLDTALGG